VNGPVLSAILFGVSVVGFFFLTFIFRSTPESSPVTRWAPAAFAVCLLVSAVAALFL
jgi:hypothetical protein